MTAIAANVTSQPSKWHGSSMAYQRQRHHSDIRRQRKNGSGENNGGMWHRINGGVT